MLHSLSKLLVPSPQSLIHTTPSSFSWIPTSGRCHLRILSPSTNAPLSSIDLDHHRRQEYARINAMAESLRKRYQHVELVMAMEEDSDEDDDFGRATSNIVTASSSSEDDDNETMPLHPKDSNSNSNSEFVFRIVGKIDGIGINGRDESYTLIINQDDASWQLVAKDMCGLFYGIQTILQLINVSTAYSALWYEGSITTEYATGGTFSNGVRVPTLTITDWPVVQHRGYMKDISRCRVPKQSELFKMVDMLASLKYNQLQLYMEGKKQKYFSFDSST
jgi:hypothetical protein